MGLHKIPAGILKELEKFKRKFFWGEISEVGTTTRKLHSIRWEIINRPKNKGGLGVHVLAWKNTTLLARWWWKARTKRGKLWNRLLLNKYGENFFKGTNIKRASPIVQSISQVQKKNKLKIFEATDFMWQLGNGDSIRFWEDTWREQGPIAINYSQMTLCTLQKQRYYNKRWQSIAENSTLHWRRPL